MKHRGVVLFFVLFCLSGGVLIYAVTRSEAIYVNQWLASIGNGEILHFLQTVVPGSQIPQWLVYSLPDALWMLALITLVLLIWDFKLHRRSIPWICLVIVVGIVFEVLQGFHIVRGTFDTVDLVLILIAALSPLSFTILNHRICKTN